MSAVCPTITAYNLHQYEEQIERVVSFSRRIHIDLMDGEFTPTRSPGLEHIWWPRSLVADVHLMYQKPEKYTNQLARLGPNLVIIHAEADVHHMRFAAELHKEGIKAGLALLQTTPVERVEQMIHSFDHVLVFSGHLGYHGGQADLTLLDKIKAVREYSPDVEIGWDGGINNQNAGVLIEQGADVLNVGGFIQDSSNPQKAYATLEAVAKNVP